MTTSVLEAFRERKLDQLRTMLDRSGTFAGSAHEAYAWALPLVEDLQELFGLEDLYGAWTRVAPGRWDAYGVPGMARWFDGRESDCVGEVMSCFAEVAAKLGLIDVRFRYDAGAWRRAGFDEGERFRGLVLRRSSVEEVIGRPSFIVDRRIYGYAQEDEAEGWAFLDFETWQGPDHDTLLRDVRLPRSPARSGLIFTH
jgi:hypothetical protein